jgi:peptidyl-tRNA hydrolase, PTH1 family
MKVIFAQGNPGIQYASSRHNVGFVALDHLAKDWKVEFVKKPRFYADIAETTIDGEKILLVKPTTFYNETGQSARAILDFYKLDPKTDFLVIHDDMALPIGTIRTRLKGSDAGNNGVKSLNAHLGDEFARIRIGIFNDERHDTPAVNFVLGMFTAHEKNALGAVIEQVERFVKSFIKGNFEPTKVVVAKE